MLLQYAGAAAKHVPMADPPNSERPPVHRQRLFASTLIEIRDNRCDRQDPARSAETEPLAFNEVCFPRRGLWCRHLGTQTLAVDPAHVHFFTEGESHRVSHPLGCGDRNTGLVLRSDLLHGFVDDVVFPRTHAPLDGRLFAAHRLLFAVASDVDADPLRVEELALDLTAMALRAAAPDREPAAVAATPAHRELAFAACVAMSEALDQPLSVGDVAERVGASPYHLCRVFRRQAGTSLHEYRLRLRLRAALELVLDTRQTLAAVAVATGFADRMHLSKQFTRAFGRPPRDWRSGSGGDRLRMLRELLPASKNRHTLPPRAS